MEEKWISGTPRLWRDIPLIIPFCPGCQHGSAVKALCEVIDEMGIEHGYDVDRILWLGGQMEKTIGRRLRSEAIMNGRTMKEGHMQYARPGLAKRKEKLGETPDQNMPGEWASEAVLPEKHRSA